MESKLRVLVFLLVTLTSVDLGYCETVKRRPALLFKRDAKEIGEFSCRKIPLLCHKKDSFSYLFPINEANVQKNVNFHAIKNIYTYFDYSLE